MIKTPDDLVIRAAQEIAVHLMAECEQILSATDKHDLILPRDEILRFAVRLDNLITEHVTVPLVAVNEGWQGDS